jgi:hypothetical protein
MSVDADTVFASFSIAFGLSRRCRRPHRVVRVIFSILILDCPHQHKKPWGLMHSKRVHSMPPQRRLLTRSSYPNQGPITRSFTQNHRAADSSMSMPDFSTTPVASREVSTEPTTPTSPTLDTRGNCRALQRERSAAFVQAVLHYDRSENDLQPWFW